MSIGLSIIVNFLLTKIRFATKIIKNRGCIFLVGDKGVHTALVSPSKKICVVHQKIIDVACVIRNGRRGSSQRNIR